MSGRALLLLTLLTTAGCSTLVSNERVRLEATEERAGTLILVTIPADAPPRSVGLTGAPGQNYQRRRGYGPSPAVERQLERVARDYTLVRIEGWPIDSIGVYCEVFEVPSELDASEVLQALSRDPRVDLAQRMNVFGTLATRYNDPYADLQTAVPALGIEPAHRLATGKGVTIAVVDSQIDTRHPELQRSIRHARDLVGSGPAGAPEIHGTAVAGIIASASNNTEGIVGIAPDAAIAALRACWEPRPNSPESQCTSFSLAQALQVALDLRVRIINLSLAGPHDALLAKMIDAASARGTIVIAAQADFVTSANDFPASHPGVIAVSRTGGGSVKHAGLTLAAPGSEILTTVPGAQYAFFSGSSLAAAHISGVAALLLERNPDFDAQHLYLLLRETAETDGSRLAVNACRALTRLVPGSDCEPRTSRSAMATGAR